jgi:intracellular multiplication protein IcmP
MFLFLLLVAWGIGFLVWKGFKPQISEAVLSVRSAQMKIAEIWYDDKDIIRVPMQEQVSKTKGFHAELGDIGTRWYDTNFGIWRDFANTAKPDQIQADHLKVVTYVALYPLRWVIVGIIACMFVWVIFTGPTSRFHRVMGLEAVIRDQAKTFKVIRPFIKFNPNHLTARPIGAPVPVDLPMFAEALSPEEWIAINEIPYIDGVLDTAAAEAAFAKQLGPRWKGAMALPAELQVILAAFCLKAARKRNEADELLGRLACCWDHKSGLRLSRERGLVRQARKILRDKKLSEKTLGNCNRHAYVSTAMMRALNTAREDGGVLAPAQFVWLRAHNRGLWYPLNNLGRQAFHMEAIAAAAHYRAEKHINRPIPRPRVMDALDGLLEHLKNPIFVRPIPEVDYGSAGRRKKKNALTKAA